MDAIDTVINQMRSMGTQDALFWNNRSYSYAAFVHAIDVWLTRLQAAGVKHGSICAIVGDYQLGTCSLVFALLELRAIVVPLTRLVGAEMDAFIEIAGVEFVISVADSDDYDLASIPSNAVPLINSFRERGTPGLVVFTSGSTGAPKGILHDCERVMRKFVAPRRGWRTVLFLMFDHFGGFNTLLSTFAYGGTGVCLTNRLPDTVCRTIASSRANLLPATPTFLNLLLASGSFREHDLSSIELITYGTEVMPQATLERIGRVFPSASVKQTYGLSELGVLRSKSEDDASPWVKLGGEGFEVSIRNNILWIRSESNMVGYLNAPNPFDDEGWFCTGDEVEVRGEYVRIIGRQSDVINVGGQKVFPAEIETVLLQADNIADAAVFPVKHPLLGAVVHAQLALHAPEDPRALSERLRQFCIERLARHKVPLRFHVAEPAELYSVRFKKLRRSASKSI
ncbi:MAG: AMP-binding protein [Chloroflexi bacterium]|nr:AMP-binding protein [Chloroflexota bacterium]